MGAYNIRSLRGKISDVDTLLHLSGLHLLCITESWTHSEIDTKELNIDGYSIMRWDRSFESNKTRGGGIVIYTSSKYKFVEMSDWHLCTPDMACLWLKLELKATRPTYICGVYRPPSGDLDNFTYVMEQKMLDIYKEGIADIILLGDFNVDWLGRDEKTKKYKNFVKNSILSQLISVPTRVTLHSRTCLDHFLTNRPELYVTSGSINPGLSDHQLVFSTRKKAKPCKEVTFVQARSYIRFNDRNFQRDIDDIDWSPVLTEPCVETATNCFLTTLNTVVDRHAPMKMMKMRNHAPGWLNTDYLAHTEERAYKSKMFDNNPTAENLEAKLESIERTANLRRNLQNTFFRDALYNCQGDSKQKW